MEPAEGGGGGEGVGVEEGLYVYVFACVCVCVCVRAGVCTTEMHVFIEPGIHAWLVHAGPRAYMHGWFMGDLGHTCMAGSWGT